MRHARAFGLGAITAARAASTKRLLAVPRIARPLAGATTSKTCIRCHDAYLTGR